MRENGHTLFYLSRSSSGAGIEAQRLTEDLAIDLPPANLNGAR